MSYDVKDSGTRRAFGTGAVRDAAEGKGRMDLLPAHAVMELAKHFEAGAKKYGDNNWRKGIPLATFLDSALRHLLKFQLGMRDERHDLAALWNIACLIETQHMIDRDILPESLANLPNNFNPPAGPVDQLPAIIAAPFATKYDADWNVKDDSKNVGFWRVRGEIVTYVAAGTTRQSVYSRAYAIAQIEAGEWVPNEYKGD